MYSVQNPKERTKSALGQAQSAYGQMMPEIEPPGKTAGGALSSGMAAAGTGAASAMALEAAGSTAMAAAMGGPWGLGIAAALGIGAYLLS
jgi:hypothetical protein